LCNVITLHTYVKQLVVHSGHSAGSAIRKRRIEPPDLVTGHQIMRTNSAIRPAPRNAGGGYPLPSAATGRQIKSRRSTSVTTMSIKMTKADSTNMPANTAATSNTPSAC
jgi:hypothetical protein